MDFARYPFDKQICFMKYRDFSHAASEVQLHPGIIRFGIDDLITFASSVGKSSGTFNVMFKTKTESEVKDNRQTLFGYLYFERNPSTFWGSTFLADILLNMAVWISFWIPPTAAPARVTLIIIAFLSFRILMSSLVSQLPAVTYKIWVLDYMAYSQFLAAGALAQIGFLFFVAFKEKSLVQFLSTVSKSKLPKLLDEDGWEMSELVVESKKVKINLQNIIREEEKEHRQKNNEKTKELASKDEPRVRGSSLDRTTAKDLKKGAESGKPKEVALEDALIIVRVSNVFLEADTNGSGFVDIVELKAILRKFGKYYSKHEVCVLVEKFKRAHGSSLEKDRLLDLESFFRLLVGLDIFAPAELPALKKLYDKSPTYILDVHSRIVYPILWAVRTVIMLSIVTAYIKP